MKAHVFSGLGPYEIGYYGWSLSNSHDIVFHHVVFHNSGPAANVHNEIGLRLPFRSFLEHNNLQRLLFRESADGSIIDSDEIIHYVDPRIIPQWEGGIQIGTVFDLNFMKYDMPWKKTMKKAFDYYDDMEVVVLSDAVKKELKEEYDIDSVNLGCPASPDFFPAEATHPQMNPEDINILCVGNHYPWKNMGVLSEMATTYREFRDTNGIRKIRYFAISDTVQPYVETINVNSNADVNKAYNAATIIMQPSLSEGHPYDIINALRCKKPILCSNIPVFKEYGKDACYYADNNDIKSYKDGLQVLLDRTAEYTSKIKVEDTDYLHWEPKILSYYESLRNEKIMVKVCPYCSGIFPIGSDHFTHCPDAPKVEVAK